MRALFVAAGRDDLAKFDSLTTPEFYVMDNGKRYDGDALMQIAQEGSWKTSEQIATTYWGEVVDLLEEWKPATKWEASPYPCESSFSK